MDAGRLSAPATIVVADIGGTHTRLGHRLDNGTVSDIISISSNRLRVADAPNTLAEILLRYQQEHALQATHFVLGIPGLLDAGRDRISHCNNLRQLEGTGLRDTLSARLGCPVYLEQDIMLQLLGEWCSGAAHGSAAVFGVYFGTGIGTAYLRDGNPFQRGSSTLQAGHIPVSTQGKLCACGNRDCVEAYASGHTLATLAQQHRVPVERLFTIDNNAPLQQALHEFIQYQAYLLASVITITEPEHVLIGGGIPTMADYPRDRLMSLTRTQLQRPQPADSVCFVWAQHGSRAAVHGAVALIQLYTNRTL